MTSLLPAEDVPVSAVPRATRPLPALTPESVVAGRPRTAGTHDAEGFVDLDDLPPSMRVSTLHTYRRTGWLHAVPSVLLRAGATRRLVDAAARLPDGWSLAVFDAWRPLALQAELHDAFAAAGGVHVAAAPSDDPWAPPPHLTGGTVDVTLAWQGRPLALGTGFDDATPLARTDAFEAAPGAVRTLRRLLYHALHDAGFAVLAEEWWHAEFGTRLWSAITHLPVRYSAASPAITVT